MPTDRSLRRIERLDDGLRHVPVRDNADVVVASGSYEQVARQNLLAAGDDRPK